MKNSTQYLTYVILALFYIAIGSSLNNCKNPVEEPSEPSFHLRADYKEVMKYHDEAMIEMGVIHNLRKKLKPILDTEPSDSSKIYTLISDLESADDGMMDWMAQFKAHENKTSLDSYLSDQLELVKKVNEDIFSSITAAKKYLDEE